MARGATSRWLLILALVPWSGLCHTHRAMGRHAGATTSEPAAARALLRAAVLEAYILVRIPGNIHRVDKPQHVTTALDCELGLGKDVTYITRSSRRRHVRDDTRHAFLTSWSPNSPLLDGLVSSGAQL